MRKGLRIMKKIGLFILVAIFIITGTANRTLCDNDRPTQLEGWPVPTDSPIESSPVMGDIDNDGDTEVVIASTDGNLYAWHHDGSLVDNFPIYCNVLRSSPALGDIDNDGDLEIVIGGLSGMIYAFHGDGSPVDGWPVCVNSGPRDNNFYSSPALADLDRNGHLEIVILSEGGCLVVYRYDGTVFDNWPVFLTYPYQAKSTPAIGDIDNDGDLEIVVGIYTGAGPPRPGLGHFYAFHHNGVLVEGWPIAAYYGCLSSPALADIDGDRDLELVFTKCGSHTLDQAEVYCYHHNGNIAAGWPQRVNLNNILSSPAIADIDRDGDCEIIVGTGSGSSRGGVYTWHHDGTLASGWPVRAPEYGINFESSPIVGDIDGDQDVEIVIGSTDSYLYAFSHNGVLVDGWPLWTGNSIEPPIHNIFTSSLHSTPALGDLDSDGYLEIAVGSRDGKLYVWDLPGPYNFRDIEWGMFHHDAQHTGLYYSDGDREFQFVDETTIRFPAYSDDSNEIDLGDIDGDGDLDIIVANRLIDPRTPDDSQNRLLINDGKGNFVDETPFRLPSVTDCTADIDLGDIDGDGDLDVAVANLGTSTCGEQNLLFINDGYGYFSDETLLRLPALEDASYDIDFGDVDSDGDLDIIVANCDIAGSMVGYPPAFAIQNRLLINDGSGYFIDETDARLPVDNDTSLDVELGDIDQDGDLDIFIANHVNKSGERNRLLINNGSGYFTDQSTTRLPDDNDMSFDAAFGDVDGDGDLDIFVANSNCTDSQSRLLINSGGIFTDETSSRLPNMDYSSWEADFGDVNNDGDLDIIVANVGRTTTGPQNLLLINNGVGIFVDKTSTKLPVSVAWSSDVDFGDIDNDGDLDIAIANSTFGYSSNDGQNHLLVNQLIQPSENLSPPDTEPPVVTITSPQQDEAVPYEGFDFMGTAWDEPEEHASGIDEIGVSVYDYGRGNFTVYHGEPEYNEDTKEWRFLVAEDKITPGARAWVEVRAVDNADNYYTQRVYVNVVPVNVLPNLEITNVQLLRGNRYALVTITNTGTEEIESGVNIYMLYNYRISGPKAGSYNDGRSINYRRGRFVGLLPGESLRSIVRVYPYLEDYQMRFFVDPRNRIEESNEDDNVYIHEAF